MKKEYKRDLQNNYLILEAPETESDGGYALQMAEQNAVKGLLQMHSSKRNGILYLHYEITSKQTLESLYEKKPMGAQDILMVLTGIRETVEDMHRYLLSPQQLLLSPEMIYVMPDRGGVRFCYYAGEHFCSITLLAEFILKRLDHRDSAAVELGYGLYERVGLENFSLQDTLKEILLSSGETGKTGAEAEYARPDFSSSGAKGPYEPSGREGFHSNTPEGFPEHAGDLAGRVEFPEKEEDLIPENDDTGGIPVEHRERKKDRKNGREKKEHPASDAAGGFFAVVHPAVLLSSLVMVSLLAIALCSGILSLTEAGGSFFLLLTLELLLNWALLHRKKQEKPIWTEEEMGEDYERLLNEMYQEEESAAEPIEETRCLSADEEPEGALRLVHQPDRPSQERYPDICPDTKPVYIGKAGGEADVILPVPTVSRLHARLQMRGEKYYLKDMNSKNGTFVNGRRLSAQEECEIRREDEIAFAEVRYRAD